MVKENVRTILIVYKKIKNYQLNQELVLSSHYSYVFLNYDTKKKGVYG